MSGLCMDSKGHATSNFGEDSGIIGIPEWEKSSFPRFWIDKSPARIRLYRNGVPFNPSKDETPYIHPPKRGQDA